jgi:hypothetical protein
LLKIELEPDVVVHVYNPSPWEAEAGELCLRPAWVIQQDSVSKETKTKQKDITGSYK